MFHNVQMYLKNIFKTTMYPYKFGQKIAPSRFEVQLRHWDQAFVWLLEAGLNFVANMGECFRAAARGGQVLKDLAIFH